MLLRTTDQLDTFNSLQNIKEQLQIFRLSFLESRKYAWRTRAAAARPAHLIPPLGPAGEF